MKLAGLRERIEPEGPTPALRAEVAQLLVPSALADKRRQLLRDLDEGLRVEAELAALPVLDPAVPFAGVGPYFTTLEQKATVAPECGERLRAWAAARLTARRNADGQAIGEKAVAALTQKLDEWRADLGRFRGAEEDVQELQASMKQIVQGRTNLVEKLPELEEILSQSVGIDELDGLSLQLVRLAFLSGGSNRSLTISVEQVDTANAKLREQRSALLTAIDNYSKSRYPQSFKAPGFLEVPPFRDARRDALGIAEEGQELPEWLLAKRRQLLREGDLLQDVAAVCGESWRDWKSDRGDEAGFEGLQQALADLKLSVRNAKQLFPGDDAAAVLDKAVPPKKLQEAERALKDDIAKSKMAERSGKWLQDLNNLNAELSRLRLADWQAEPFDKTVELLNIQLGDLGEGANDSTLRAQLKKVETEIRKWTKAKNAFEESEGLLGRAQIKQCLAQIKEALAWNVATDEFRKLQKLASSCQDAFEEFESNLDFVGIRGALKPQQRTARDSGWSQAEDCIKLWLNELKKVETAGAQMFAIAAPPSSGVRAFFIAATECSNGDFAAFTAELRAQGASNAARWAAVKGKLQGVGMTSRRLSAMLDRFEEVPEADIELPANVDWYWASAYCAWKEVELPTRADWIRATFLDSEGGKKPFAWGAEPIAESKKQKYRNCLTRAVGVREGGLSWRSGDAGSLHHLTGNMAEWLAGDDSTEADLAGGGFTDLSRVSETWDLWRGVKFTRESRSTERADVGFRWVLRPRDVMDWPSY